MQNDPPGFDLWLRRDLRRQFGTVMADPIPAELLALVEAPGNSH